jgi:hypothetical protein
MPMAWMGGIPGSPSRSWKAVQRMLELPVSIARMMDLVGMSIGHQEIRMKEKAF